MCVVLPRGTETTVSPQCIDDRDGVEKPVFGLYNLPPPLESRDEEVVQRSECGGFLCLQLPSLFSPYFCIGTVPPPTPVQRKKLHKDLSRPLETALLGESWGYDVAGAETMGHVRFRVGGTMGRQAYFPRSAPFRLFQTTYFHGPDALLEALFQPLLVTRLESGWIRNALADHIEKYRDVVYKHGEQN